MNKPEEGQETTAFDVYFASIRSMQFHPGAGTREHVVLTTEQCACEAMDMIRHRRAIFDRED